MRAFATTLLALALAALPAAQAALCRCEAPQGEQVPCCCGKPGPCRCCGGEQERPSSLDDGCAGSRKAPQSQESGTAALPAPAVAAAVPAAPPAPSAAPVPAICGAWSAPYPEARLPLLI